ncbi:DUF2231 domain-containing protein [Aquamicrobium sp. LC103]|uniref:DUF2231 domain-containing protein n=1 Tax=Aquamicrobium sp. LC103 TaxID=1120658 RepID=UPI00063EBA96|nr:DUF2231 domain-containing protein [Aquamicrobium sp. LC103]TKT74369.1 DUF2231 domain-containing protein [Aquamicrobium sp. LC103]
MTEYQTLRYSSSPVHSIYLALVAFPIACFSLTVLSDIAYWQTSNLMWLHFSEWLLLAGLVFGVLAAAVRALDYLLYRTRPVWLAVLGGVVVLCLAALNSFVHTADGWTAVVPYGLILSIVTVLVMIVTGWLGWRGGRHA